MNKTVVAKPKEFKLQLYFLKLKCVFFHADSLNFAPTKKLNEKKNASTEHQRPIDFCIQSKPKQKQTQKTIEIHTVVHKYSYGCKRNWIKLFRKTEKNNDGRIPASLFSSGFAMDVKNPSQNTKNAFLFLAQMLFFSSQIFLPFIYAPCLSAKSKSIFVGLKIIFLFC